MKGILAAFAILAATGALAAPSISEAYASAADGSPVAAELGVPFYVTAKIQTESNDSGSYQLNIDTPYQHLQTPALTGGGTRTIIWGQLTPLMAGDLKVTITLRAGAIQTQKQLLLHPALPIQALDFYAPRNLQGYVQGQTVLSKGSTSTLNWWLPQPQAAPSQEVVYLANPVGAHRETTSLKSQDIAVVDGGGDRQVQFGVRAFSFRSDPKRLAAGRFSDLRRLPPSISVWLKPETNIESNSSAVAKFVESALPARSRGSYNVYPAAQRLFQATVAKLQYDATQTDPDVIRALQSGRGDCGSFAAVFTAACRNVGIPARPVVGMVAGENQWHVWAEFYVPLYGWVQVDPAMADGIDPSGCLPLYFGVIPDGNQRTILTYGFEHTLDTQQVEMLQAPAVFLNGATIQEFDSFCGLHQD